MNRPVKDPGILGGLHPFVKLLLLLLVMIASLMVVFIIGIIAAIPFFGTGIFKEIGADTMNINMLRYTQILTHLGFFVGASLVFSFLVGYDPLGYLRGKQKPGLQPLLISALIIMAAAPLVYYMTHLNQQLDMPESMRSIEEWMRRTEDQAEAMTRLLLDVTTLQGLLFNIFMIAVIPAIGEEFIFRGAVQRIFRQWTGNIHVAVIIAAFLFSAMHMQFYGFLPRLLLGMILGYMFVVTGNIWVPVFAHFFNNAAAVMLYFFTQNSKTDFDIETIGLGPFAWIMALVSLILVVGLFKMMRYGPGKPPPDNSQ